MYGVRTINIGGKEISLTDKGEGEVILFLHGYLSMKESFNYQLAYFARGYRVIAADLTGFGKSGMMEKPYSLDDYAAEVVELLNYLGIKKCHIIGHSFGGRIALKLAANTDFCDKLVLTGSAGLKPRRGPRYYAKIYTYKLLKKFADREKLDRKFGSPDYVQLSPVMKESFKLIVNEHLDALLPEIKNPVLIINGDRDRETPPWTAKKFNRKIRNSELVFIKGAGHFAFIDDYNTFNIVVNYFLKNREKK